MKSLIILGLVLHLSGSFAGCPNSCTTSCAINDLASLNNIIQMLGNVIGQKSRIVCQEVYATGNKATCPTDYTPSACACGMACGSWDIQSGNTCHCQCAGIDWTNAHCCKIVVQ